MTVQEQLQNLIIEMNRPKTKGEFPIDPWKLTMPGTEIIRVPYSEVSDKLAKLGYIGPMTEDGLATFFDGCFYIVWCDDVTGGKLLDVLEHEFGHIACGHVTKNRCKPFTIEEDIEADLFVDSLKTSPETLLSFDIRSSEEIHRLIRVPMKKAESIARRVEAIRARREADHDRNKGITLWAIAFVMAVLLLFINMIRDGVAAEKENMITRREARTSPSAYHEVVTPPWIDV